MVSSPGDREALIYRSKIAEQAERYDEMAEAMKELVTKCFAGEKDELTVEERNLLSVAYKNAVGARRASWRIISSVEHKEQDRGIEAHEILAGEYRQKVEEELMKICTEMLDLLSSHLIPRTQESESTVFYHKMKGDYYRYISEFTSSDKKEEASKNAAESYQQATEVAKTELPSTHPIRLGLALNYSVFYYEIIGKPDVACEMAKRAFDDAITEFDNVNEDSYKDSTLIMQLLRDNLTLWTTDLPAEAGNAKAAGGSPKGGKGEEVENGAPQPATTSGMNVADHEPAGNDLNSAKKECAAET